MRLAVLAFLGGVLSVQFSPALPPPVWGLLLVPALLAVLRWRRFLPVVFVLFGVAWTGWRAGLVLSDALPPVLEGRDLVIEGHIADLPRAGERGQRFAFDVEHATLDDRGVTIPHRVLLSLYDRSFAPAVGDRWRLTVRLKQPHGFQNPGGFDYEAHLFQERIRATGYVRRDPAPTPLPDDGHAYRLGRARQWLGEAMRAALPEHAFVPMLVAFVNGDEQGITDEQWRVLQRTGTTHLIAISGMNIGLVAGFVFFLAGRLWAWPGRTVLLWPAPKVGAAAALFAATGYAALAGFAIPTQRALVMVCALMLGLVLSRRASSSHLLAAALFAVLLYDPLAAMSAGFWLSFVSVAVILFFLHGERRDARRWLQWGRLQWAITLGLLPLTVLLFQQVPLAGPLANLLAIPAIELAVIPLSLVGALLLSLGLGALAAYALALAAAVLQWLWIPLAGLAGYDALQWTQHQPTGWVLVAAVIGTAWLLAPRGWPARWLGGVWLLPMFLVRPPTPPAGEVWLTLLDVGQGLAAVVRTQHHVLVYDTGARFSDRFDAGRAVVVPYLRSRGMRAVDMLIVSHGDNDHIGGAGSVRAGVPVRETLSSVPERLPGAVRCRRGQQWQWDGVTFTMLSPADIGAHGNNACCVLRVAGGHGTALMPGDIEAVAERELVARYGGALSAQVLIAPHHGSKTSSTAEFIDSIRPRYVLYPVGYRNPYHHPHPRVAARYAASGSTPYASAGEGAIEIRLGADGPRVSRYRETARRYWFAPQLAAEQGL